MFWAHLQMKGNPAKMSKKSGKNYNDRNTFYIVFHQLLIIVRLERKGTSEIHMVAYSVWAW